MWQEDGDVTMSSPSPPPLELRWPCTFHGLARQRRLPTCSDKRARHTSTGQSRVGLGGATGVGLLLLPDEVEEDSDPPPTEGEIGRSASGSGIMTTDTRIASDHSNAFSSPRRATPSLSSRLAPAFSSRCCARASLARLPRPFALAFSRFVSRVSRPLRCSTASMSFRRACDRRPPPDPHPSSCHDR